MLIKTCELEIGLDLPTDVIWRLEWHFINEAIANDLKYHFYYEQLIEGCDIKYSGVITNRSRSAEEIGAKQVTNLG